jgi:CheY-like chemotaxis protein
MLKKVAGVIVFKVEERKQDFYIYIDGGIPPLLVADEQRLAQVITNLLSNAVKFTPEGGRIGLEARLLGVENNICTLRIAVNDTGIGITEEQKKRLFHAFEQADSSISRKFGGTGLGLAISKRIVEMMGGQLVVDSEIDKGATFTFTVRAECGTGEAGGLEIAGGAVRRPRLLLLDVDAISRDCFKDIVARFGLDCAVADNGDAAAALLKSLEKREDTVDICFVDWKIPGTDDFTLVRRIRAEHPDAVFVFIAPVSEWAHLEIKAKEAGVGAHLYKPFFPSSVISCINEYIGVDGQIERKTAGMRGQKDNFAGHRVLLAEDVDINREIIMELLRPTSLEFVCVGSGAEAVAVFSRPDIRFDLILMDVQMPEMDGYEATRRIREMELASGSRIPIVAMTANVFNEDVEKCLEAGMDAHLGKPINLNEVLGILRKYL